MIQRDDIIEWKATPRDPVGALRRVDAKQVAVGGAIALVAWLALVPIGFLLW